MGKGLGRDGKKVIEQEQDKKNRERKKKERQVLVAYMSEPSSPLSQLTVNEHCVTDFLLHTYCGHCSVSADANIVVTLLSPPISCSHFIDPHTVKFMA